MIETYQYGLAANGNDVYAITGPIDGYMKQIDNVGSMRIPTSYFKILMWCESNQPKIAYLIFGLEQCENVVSYAYQDKEEFEKVIHLKFNLQPNAICHTGVLPVVVTPPQYDQPQIAAQDIKKIKSTCTISSPLLTKVDKALKVKYIYK